MTKEEINNAISELKELVEDDSMPKNVRTKISQVIENLQTSEDASIIISRAIHDFEEISEDVNLQPYARTKIWAAVSVLETIQN